MRCGRCGEENREGRKFCAGCGAELGWRCPFCGFANEAGENAALNIAYVKVPELTFRPASQRYSCNWRAPTGAIVTYEGLFRGFKADLALDADGLVIDYPETFRRIAPR